MKASVDEVRLPWCGTSSTWLRSAGPARASSAASCAASMSPVSSRLRPSARLHAQHAAQRVGARGLRIVARQRVQQLEAHAVPVPGLAGQAAPVRHAGAQQRMPVGQRAGQRAHRQLRQQRGRAADMVGVAVAQHQQVDVALAAGAQQRQQHALRRRRPRANSAARRRRPAGARGCAPAPPCPGRCRPPPPRSCPAPAAAPAAPAAAAAAAAPSSAQPPGQRQQQQRTAQQADRDAPAWRCGGRPQAARAARPAASSTCISACTSALATAHSGAQHDAGQRQRHDRPA